MKTEYRSLRAWFVIAMIGSFFPAAFAQTVTFTVSNYFTGDGTAPISVVPVSMNGSLPDLITADENDDYLTGFTNNGNGVFAISDVLIPPITAFPLGFFKTAITTADVLGNGQQDLITLTSLGGPGYSTLLTFGIYNGTNFNGTNPFGPVTVGDWPYSVIATNITDGQWPDLICTYSPTSIMVLSQAFSRYVYNGEYQVGQEPVCIATTSIHGNGVNDLITANELDNTLSVLTNNGDGTLGSNATLNVGYEPSWVIAADVNGDGKPDLVAANFGDNTLTVYTNNGNGVFGYNETLNVGKGPTCIAAADLLGNGRLDLITANALDNTVTVLLNQGGGIFTSNATIGVGMYPLCVITTDLNGDGRPDLVTANPEDDSMTVLLNTTSAPYLYGMPNGNEITLSWPAWATNYVLETTTDLTASNWTAVNPSSNPVTVGMTGSAAFFRLHQY